MNLSKVRILMTIAVLCVTALIIVATFQQRRSKEMILAQHADVVLTKDGFVPHDTWLTRGGSVTFRTTSGKRFWPASDSHPSHSIYAEFDPKEPIEPNDTWTFVFEQIGDFGFHDHLRSYFIGNVRVR